MPSEHREVLQRERVQSVRALHLHREALSRRTTARAILAAERARSRWARTVHARELAAARVDAHTARIFLFLQRRLKKAA